MTEIFIVSDEPDRIAPSFEGVPTTYESADAAGRAIQQDVHGEYGTRYVLKVTLEQVAEYYRPWTLRRKDGPHG